MDIFHWMVKNKIKAIVVAVVLFIIVPFAIDKIFSTPNPNNFVNVRYMPNDILAFYGAVLGSSATILALIATIQHTEKIHSLDYERKMTPMLNSNLFSSKNAEITPFRIKYVNITPNCIYSSVGIFESLDPRDLKDTFFDSQIDYLVQNVSETSAIDIKILLNDMLLCDPFSLIAGSEASIGIRFFDKRDLPSWGDYTFNISIEYTNSMKNKRYKQTEVVFIRNYIPIFNDREPIVPDYDKRTGISPQTVIINR